MIEITELLKQPESKVLEFKENLSSMNPILTTIVAFANTAGGVLIIGVSQKGKITGIADVLKSEEKLANAIADTITPPILPEIEIATVNKKHLLIVRVSHWRAPFYLRKQGIPRGVYIRLGSTSRPAGPEIISELNRSVLNLSFDQQGIPSLSPKALDMGKIKDSFKSIHKEINEKKLRSLGILAPSNSRFIPSIGGLILFGKREVRDQHVPDARVKCARFAGTNKSVLLDQYEIEGTILDAVREVPKFIARNTRLGAKIQKIRRKDLPEYPKIAIREVLINALAHADYSITGSTIQIAIFDDRLEVHNPGMLPFGFTMNDLKAGISRVRNRIIAKVFHELKLMEAWGSGYQRVIEACRQDHYSDPEWIEHGTSMLVTFYSKKRPASKQLTADPLTTRQKAILALFKKGKQIPFKTIYKSFSEEISERTLRYELSRLKKPGYLISSGRGPSTVWQRSI